MCDYDQNYGVGYVITTIINLRKNCITASIMAVRQAFSRYEFVRQWDFFNESADVGSREEHAISVLQNLWDVQQGIRSLEEEMVERHCIEAIRLLVSLWIVHCFEKTEEARWQRFPNFYAELFGNSNPRQIIQSLSKAQLNNASFSSSRLYITVFVLYGTEILLNSHWLITEVEMVLLMDALRIRLELLDCSCNGVDAEQPELPRSFVPEDAEKEISARPTLTFLKSIVMSPTVERNWVQGRVQGDVFF
uniref:Uncharacterized protein n=1 Tax=Setaria digitata TaxID=48799 RepID=A0A915Q395_9BILA